MIELGDDGHHARGVRRGSSGRSPVTTRTAARSRGCRTTRAQMLAHVATGVPAYGVTTGLGHLAGVAVSTDDQAELQRSLLTARAAGLRRAAPAEVVRGAMLVRLAGFLHGAAGVTPALCRFDRRPPQRRLVARRPERALRRRRRDRPARAPLPDLRRGGTGRGSTAARCPPPMRSPRRASSPTSRSRRRVSRSSTARRSRRRSGSRSPNAAAGSSRRRRRPLRSALALTRSGARALSPRVGRLAGDAFALRVQSGWRRCSRTRTSGATEPSRPCRRASCRRSTARRSTLAALDALLDVRLRGTTDSPLYLHADGGDESGLYPSGRLPRRSTS